MCVSASFFFKGANLSNLVVAANLLFHLLYKMHIIKIFLELIKQIIQHAFNLTIKNYLEKFCN